MADITLHSGSFCDRNDNEIIITFFKKDSTPMMTIDPTSISKSYMFWSENLVRLSNVVGNVSIVSKPDWISYTRAYAVDDQAGYLINFGRNTDYVQRSGIVTFADENSSVELPVTQGTNYVTEPMTADPSSISFNASDIDVWKAVTIYNVDTELFLPSSHESWFAFGNSRRVNETTWAVPVTCMASNTSASSRNATVEISDLYNRSQVTLGITQAGVSSVSLNKNILSFGSEQESQTVTVTWVGGHTPTYNFPDWCTVTASGTTSPMTLTVTVSANTGDTRSAAVTFTNGISQANLQVTQTAATVLYVLPDQLSYDAEGGLWMVTVYWTGNVTPTYTINYGSGSGWLVQRGEPVPVASHEVQYIFRAEANSNSGTRSASIVFSLWQLTETVSVTQAGTTPATISVDKAQISDVSATGATDIVTVTYSGEGYITPSGYDSWVTVTYKDAPTTTTVRYDINIAQNTGTARNTTITWTGSLGGTATTTVSQVAPAVAWTVSPSTINNVGYNGGTYNLTFTGTPSIGMGYEVDPYTADWVTANISSLSAATVTVGANATTSQRSATVKFYKMDDHSTYITVSITQEGMPVIWSVVPSAITNGLAAGNTYNVSMSGIPSAGMSYDIIYGSGNNWITIASFPNTDFTLTTSANSSISSRDATVKYIDLSDSSHYITTTVHQYGQEADPLHVYTSSMSFAAEGGNQGTIVENIVGTLSITPPEWITVSTSGSGGTRTVGVHASANSSTIARSGSVVFDDDRQSPVTMAVSQEGAAAPTPTLSVSPTTIAYNPHGGTNGVTARWTVTAPSATISYVQGASGWLSAISPVVSEGQSDFAWTADMNDSASTRTAVVTISNGGEPEYVSITQSYYTMTISPNSVLCDSSDQIIRLKVYYGGNHGDDEFAMDSITIPYGSNFTSIDFTGIGYEGGQYVHYYDVLLLQNSTGSTRQALIKFVGETGVSKSISITQEG